MAITIYNVDGSASDIDTFNGSEAPPLKWLQDQVGGYIGMLPTMNMKQEPVQLIFDDDGLRNGLEKNVYFEDFAIVGTVIMLTEGNLMEWNSNW